MQLSGVNNATPLYQVDLQAMSVSTTMSMMPMPTVMKTICVLRHGGWRLDAQLETRSKVDHIEGSALVRSADLTDLLSHAFVAKTRETSAAIPQMRADTCAAMRRS